MITAGRLRHRVLVEQYARVDDDTGGWDETWSPLGTYWASVEAASGNEAVVAGALRGEVAWKVIMRPVSAQIDAKDRLVWNGRTLKVNAVLPSHDGDAWTLLCREERSGA